MKERAGCEVVHEGSWEIQRWNRELTLKCKLKCYMKPMKDPLGVSPSKGKQGATRGKENGRSNPEVVGSIPTEVKRFFLYLAWFPYSLY